MPTIKDDLIALAKARCLSIDPAAPSFDCYKLVIVGKDTVTSSGQAFTEGQLAIARPDTFELAGKRHRAVYSGLTRGHVAMPTADVKMV